MYKKKFTRKLHEVCGKLLKTDVDLKPYSRLKTGGMAPYFIKVSDKIIAEEKGEEELPLKTIEQLKNIITFLNQEGVKYRVLGKGTNIIIKDGIVEPVVIYLQFQKISCWQELKDSSVNEKKLLRLPASIPLIRALKIAQEFHLQGLEFVAGIPGSVGGAVVMNAGVKKNEIKNILKSSTVLRKNNIELIDKKNLNLNYRHSNITDEDIVIQAEFELIKTSFKETQKLRKKILEDLQKRKKTQPLKAYSIGSTFKNPLPEYAGALIESCGLKDKRCGGIRVSPVHANFIINDGNGTSTEALQLIKLIQETVYAHTGINLEMEVKKFGF